MLEQFKRKATKNSLIRIIIALIVAIGSLIISDFAIITLLQGPVNFIPGEDYKNYEGKYVTYDIEYVISDFMTYSTVDSDTKVETLKKISYLVYDDTNYYFFGVEFPKSHRQKLDDHIDETIDWLYEDIDTTTIRTKVTGTFTKLEGESLTYFNETLDEFEELVEQDFSDITIPYYIRHDIIGGFDLISVYIFGAVTLFGIIYALYITIRLLTGSYDKKLKEFISKNPSISMHHIESDFASAQQVAKTIWVGRRFTHYFEGIYAHIIENKSLVWAYYYKRTGKHAQSLVRTYNMDKKLVAINCSESDANVILEEYSKNQPHILIGYDNETEKMFNKEFQSFLAIKYNEAIATTNENSFHMNPDINNLN